MKATNLLLAALALGGAVLAQSCAPEKLDPEKTEPVFPEKVQELKIDAENLRHTIVIEPNMAWKIDLVGDQADLDNNVYWLEYEDAKHTSISGKTAGKVSFDVVFNEIQNHDKDQSCEIKLTMGGQSKVIAVVSRFLQERNVEFSIAGKTDEAFTQEYTVGNKVELATFAKTADYTRPIRIKANYSWKLILPEWCETYVDGALVEQTITAVGGETKNITIKGIPSADMDMKAETTAKLKVVDANVESEFTEFDVVLPAFGDRKEVISESEYIFTNDCKYKTAAGIQDALPKIGIISTKDYVIRLLTWEQDENSGEAFYGTSFANWCGFESSWNELGGALQAFELTPKIQLNYKSSARAADVLYIPAALANDGGNMSYYLNVDDFTGNASLKEEFKPYLVARFTQEANGEKIIVKPNQASAKKLAESDEWYKKLSAKFDVTEVYEITTAKKNGLSVEYTPGFWNIETFSADGKYTDLSANGMFEQTGERVARFTFAPAEKDDFIIVFHLPETPESENLVPACAVHYVYDPDFKGVEFPAPFKFVEPDKVKNAVLEPFSGNFMEIQSMFFGVDEDNVYQLTYSAETVEHASIKCPAALTGFFGYNCEWLEETDPLCKWLSAVPDAADPTIITVSMKVTDNVDYFTWQKPNYETEYVLVCTRTK